MYSDKLKAAAHYTEQDMHVCNKQRREKFLIVIFF